MSITLIGGGARSGKSRYALDLARQCGGRLAFLATARAEDNEMRDRIAQHREERAAAFTTFEEPLAVGAVIAAEAGRFDTIVVDCLTLWLSNLMFADTTLRPCSAGQAPRIAPHVGQPSSAAAGLPPGACGLIPFNPAHAGGPAEPRPGRVGDLPHDRGIDVGQVPDLHGADSLLTSPRLLEHFTGRIDAECRLLVECAATAPARVLLVTNEVGCSIVPENALARRFRDAAGKLNQQAAEAANEVYWMIFGVPLKVK